MVLFVIGLRRIGVAEASLIGWPPVANPPVAPLTGILSCSKAT